MPSLYCIPPDPLSIYPGAGVHELSAIRAIKYSTSPNFNMIYPVSLNIPNDNCSFFNINLLVIS